MKCYRKNGSDCEDVAHVALQDGPSMKCYRKNGSDGYMEGIVGVRINPQ